MAARTHTAPPHESWTTAAPEAARVAGLVKRYGARVAVDGVDLTVHRGKVLGLLGPNGAGKTTTLECLEGLRCPDAGTLDVLGVDPPRHPQRLRPLIGVQLQRGGLPGAMRVAEAMAFLCAYHRVAPRWDLRERLGLEGHRRTPYRALSTGLQRRLALALAIAHRPALLVLDEPTAGLDVASRAPRPARRPARRASFARGALPRAHRPRPAMTAPLLHHLRHELRAGVRDPAVLLLNDLFPLGFYALVSAVMTRINPLFADALLPAMVLFAALSGPLLGLPGPLVDEREAGVYRTWKVNGVPAIAILAAPTLASMGHALVVAAVVVAALMVAMG